jgi:hypothetical protein
MNGHVQSFHALRRIGSTSGNFLYNDARIDPSGVISTHGLLFTHPSQYFQRMQFGVFDAHLKTGATSDRGSKNRARGIDASDAE